MSERANDLRKRQLMARQAAAMQPAAPGEPVTPNPDGTYGQPPADMFANPTTGQMTSRDMLRENATTGAGRAGLFGASQGTSFGYSDELAGGVGYLEGGPEMAKFRMEQARAALEANRDAHPVASIAGEVGGAMLPAVASAPAAIGKGLVGTMARGAGIGAIEGGLYGSGTGEGLAGRGKNALQDLFLGSIVGGMTPAAVSGVKAGARAVADPLGGALNLGNKGRAYRAVANTVRHSDKSLDDITGDIMQASAQGQPEYRVMDALGTAGQRRASGLVRSGGDSADELAEFLTQRQAGQGDRVGSFVSDAFDVAGTTAKRTEAGLRAGRDATADAAYSAARGNAAPVDIRSAVSAIDDRIGGMQGVDIAGDGIDAKLSRFRKRLIANKTPEGVDSIELSDFDRVLGVKQDVQDAIGAAVRAGRNNEARELGKLVSALDEALEGSSDMYRAANDGYRESSRVIDAVGRGADMTRPGRYADNIDQFGAMTPDQQSAARVGYGDKLLNKIEANAAPTANRAKPLMSPKAVNQADAMAIDPRLLRDRLARENTMWETQNRAIGGSKTADNMQDIDATSGVVGGIGRAAKSLANMNFGDAVVQSVGALAPKMTGQNEATRKLLAQALMSQDPNAALGGAMSKAGSEALRQRFIEALLRNATRQNLPSN